MTLKTGWYKAVQITFIILTIIGVLLLGRMGFVMSMSAYINNLAKEGTHDPAEVYYLAQAYTGDFMEPYKAFYNAGTAYANNEDYNTAETFLSTALSQVDHTYNECYIRNNLAIVYEKQGDFYKESEMTDVAESYYDKAVTTIQDSPPACFPPPPPGGGGESENDESENNEDGGDNENPVTPTSPPPSDMPETGEQMEETEQSSQGKGDEIREEKGESPDGKEQVESEMDQSQGETQNREDQTEQEQQSEQNPEQVEKPW